MANPVGKVRMRTLAPGSKQAPISANRGFTLLELLLVVAIMAMATAGVSLAMRDSASTALEREAQRVAALLESGRAQSRLSGNMVRWRTVPNGFALEGLPDPRPPFEWLSPDVQATAPTLLVLGPEPIIGPQSVQLASLSKPDQRLIVSTDGVRPFTVTAQAEPRGGGP